MDWIKLCRGFFSKPEVKIVAKALGVPRSQAAEWCLDVFWWFGDNTEDGNARSVTASDLDDMLRTPGLASALIKAGWVEEVENGLSLVNFDRHNSQAAKQRALTSRRVDGHRARVKRFCNDPIVTSPLPEKRREEKSKVQEYGNPSLEMNSSHCACPNTSENVSAASQPHPGSAGEQIEVASPSGKRKRKPTGECTAAFCTFWAAYPRKVGKRAAEKSFASAASRASPETILAAAKAFASSPKGRDPQFCPHASTWLNQDRWEDDPATWQVVNSNGFHSANGYKAADNDGWTT